jgi:hypothetical protein
MSSSALLLLLAAASPSPSPAPAFERAIEVRSPGRTAVRVDRAVYEGARADLGDVRVLDEEGALVPFVVDRGQGARVTAPPRPVIRNRGWRSDRALTAVLDFGGRARRSRLRLELSGDNFRRRVAVEGSEDGVAWVTLVDEAWVFAIPGSDAARYETLALPDNDFPYLRVTVQPGDGEKERIEIAGASLPGTEPPARELPLVPAWTVAEVKDSRETWLNLDLGARHQPFHAIELAVGDERFFREVRVEARRDPATASSPVPWVEIGRGALHRLEHGSRRRECLRLDVSGRERALRLRIRNGDDRPLAIREVSVRVPVERVAFEAQAGHSYRLAYGSPLLATPSFDLARTVEDPVAWTDAAATGSLGPERRTTPAATKAPPWTERHPALLWAALVAVVVALGGLTLRALRSPS